MIVDELQAIGKNLEFLKKGYTLDLKSIITFEAEYRGQVGDRCRQITVPHFDRASRVNLEKIFVPPRFTVTTTAKFVTELAFPDFLIRAYRSVVLGDPGGGKSTLAQDICYEMSMRYSEKPILNRPLTPILVVLREYSARKKSNTYSILQFIESEVTSKYQMSRAPPEKAFEYLLHSGRMLVVFDGLDELLDPSHRREVVQDIESFCNLYPSTPIIVTSRIVGYEKAPLDPSVFEVFRLSAFDEDQVEDYSKRWFSNDPDLAADEQERRARDFLDESRIVSDLRSNPLMLALMCNLYRGAGYMPRNRPEVYRKCAEMLFERWDPSRGIWVYLPLSEPKAVLGYLAHWIYSEEAHQSGVTEDQLIKQCTKFLYPKHPPFQSEEQAERAAKEFVEFCRGRAWVFTDVGTAQDGQPLYKFTHRTFLEYFTAVQIVRKNNSAKKLWDFIGPKVAQRSWDVVAQLSLQMLHEQVEEASDHVLRLLLRDAASERSARFAYLSFGARCLQFLLPSPETIRALTGACIKLVVADAREPNQEARWFSRSKIDPAYELTCDLMNAATEIRDIVALSIQSSIVTYANRRDKELSLRAVEFVHELPLFLQGSEDQYWLREREKIRSSIDLHKRTMELATDHFLAILFGWPNAMSIKIVLSTYGLDHVFLRERSLIFTNVIYSSIAELILSTIPQADAPAGETASQLTPEIMRVGVEIGKFVLRGPKPCFTLKTGDLDCLTMDLRQVIWNKGPRAMKGHSAPRASLDGELVFGVWFLVAATSECAVKFGAQEHLLEKLRSAGSSVLDAIADVAEARFRGLDYDSSEVLNHFREFGLSSVQMQFVEQWVMCMISIVSWRNR